MYTACGCASGPAGMHSCAFVYPYLTVTQRLRKNFARSVLMMVHNSICLMQAAAGPPYVRVEKHQKYSF